MNYHVITHKNMLYVLLSIFYVIKYRVKKKLQKIYLFT